MKNKSNFIDFTGKTIKETKVIKRVDSIYEECGTLRTAFLCILKCGHEQVVKGRQLQRKSTPMCKTCNSEIKRGVRKSNSIYNKQEWINTNEKQIR